MAYCLQKQIQSLNGDKRPRPQLELPTIPLPCPVQLKLSINSTTSNKPTNICSHVNRGSLRTPPVLMKLMTLKKSYRHKSKLLPNLPRDKVHFKLKLLPHPTSMKFNRGEARSFPSPLPQKKSLLGLV